MRDAAPRLPRRRVLLLLAGAPAALPPALGPRRAGAARGWCRVDPVVRVDGRTARLRVAADVPTRREARALSTGPIQLVLRVPAGAEAEHVASDDGFGLGYAVSVEEDGGLAAGAVEVAVWVPMRDGAVPVRAGFVARGPGPHGAAEAEGTANAWLTFRAEAGGPGRPGNAGAGGDGAGA